MHTGANYIKSTSETLSTNEKSVQATIETLMSTWKGGSAIAFNSAMQPFYDECQSIINTLTQLSADVDASANAYEATHEQNTQTAHALAAKIPSGLSGF
jgi:WXG100 family type VII secretion target